MTTQEVGNVGKSAEPHVISGVFKADVGAEVVPTWPTSSDWTGRPRTNAGRHRFPKDLSRTASTCRHHEPSTARAPR